MASQVSSHYQAGEHHKRILGSEEFSADLDTFFIAMDQPTTDGLNTFFVSKAVSELGWKVALSGVGGDEMFCGYPSFQDIPKWVRTMSMPSRIPGLGGVFSHLTSHIPHLNPKAAGLIKYGGSYAGAYLLRRGVFLPDDLPELMGAENGRRGFETTLSFRTYRTTNRNRKKYRQNSCFTAGKFIVYAQPVITGCRPGQAWPTRWR